MQNSCVLCRIVIYKHDQATINMQMYLKLFFTNYVTDSETRPHTRRD